MSLATRGILYIRQYTSGTPFQKLGLFFRIKNINIYTLVHPLYTFLQSVYIYIYIYIYIYSLAQLANARARKALIHPLRGARAHPRTLLLHPPNLPHHLPKTYLKTTYLSKPTENLPKTYLSTSNLLKTNLPTSNLAQTQLKPN